MNLDVTLCKSTFIAPHAINADLPLQIMEVSTRYRLLPAAGYPTRHMYSGMHGDLNATYPVGKVDEASLDLIKTTKQSLDEAIAICKPGALYRCVGVCRNCWSRRLTVFLLVFRDIGNKIESIVKPKGYSIVRQYTGHGIDQRVSPHLGRISPCTENLLL